MSELYRVSKCVTFPERVLGKFHHYEWLERRDGGREGGRERGREKERKS